MPETPHRSFRLSDEAYEVIRSLSRKWGISTASVIEMLTRKAAEKEGIDVGSSARVKEWDRSAQR